MATLNDEIAKQPKPAEAHKVAVDRINDSFKNGEIDEAARDELLKLLVDPSQKSSSLADDADVIDRKLALKNFERSYVIPSDIQNVSDPGTALYNQYRQTLPKGPGDAKNFIYNSKSKKFVDTSYVVKQFNNPANTMIIKIDGDEWKWVNGNKYYKAVKDLRDEIEQKSGTRPQERAQFGRGKRSAKSRKTSKPSKRSAAAAKPRKSRKRPTMSKKK